MTQDREQAMKEGQGAAERRWEVKTNRHPNCDGTLWGWIEGAPGNVCWSNSYGSNRTRTDAERLVREHNQNLVVKLEDQ